MKQDKEYTHALSIAFRFLAVRDRSCKEVERHLAKKKIPAGIICEVTKRLKELGYINDALFAESWISYRKRYNPKGKFALKWELSQKGIENGIIESALAEYDEIEAACAAARNYMKRKGLFNKNSRQDIQRRVYRYLKQKGFSHEACMAALDSATGE